jgi:hypothetical protein
MQQSRLSAVIGVLFSAEPAARGFVELADAEA